MVKYKKGDVATVIFVAFILFVIGLGMFVGHMVLNKIIPELESAYNDTYSGSDDSEVFKKATQATDKMDTVYLGLFIGFLIAMVVTSYLTPAHPAMMGIFFLVVMILVVVAATLSNVWERFTDNAAFTTTTLSFPKTELIMNYLPWYIGVIGLVSMVILYMRYKNEQVMF